MEASVFTFSPGLQTAQRFINKICIHTHKNGASKERDKDFSELENPPGCWWTYSVYYLASRCAAPQRCKHQNPTLAMQEIKSCGWNVCFWIAWSLQSEHWKEKAVSLSRFKRFFTINTSLGICLSETDTLQPYLIDNRWKLLKCTWRTGSLVVISVPKFACVLFVREPMQILYLLY